MLIDKKSGLPLHNQRVSDTIDNFEYDTEESDMIGHKLINDQGFTANEFEILYRTPGGRYFTYRHKNLPGNTINPLQADISLNPIAKKEAMAFYDQLSDQHMTKAEAFERVFDA